MGKPSVYPTGVTIYKKEKACSGYTIFAAQGGAVMIDMNGRAVKVWKGLDGTPVKLLPGGYVMGGAGKEKGEVGHSGNISVVEADWDGNVVWRFSNNRPAETLEGEHVMSARQHHDYQREGSSAGYYAPSQMPEVTGGKTILLTRDDVKDDRVSDMPIQDERIIEVDWEGNLLWEWSARDHFEEFGLDDTAKAVIRKNPCGGDWIHLNAVSVLGKNRHYDAGDNRFAPENLICSARQLNTVFIIEKKTGNVVWRIGPNYIGVPLGQIIGQHGAHMIAEGLPGAGNILLFDNGSFGGYGEPTATAPNGWDTVRRHYSRVLEFNPVTLEVELEYMHAMRRGNSVFEFGADHFMSAFISFAQRLPNGNTLITEGADGRLFEITPEKEIVWEFVNPLEKKKGPPPIRSSIYRAYRYPYSWVPQLSQPEEFDIIPPENAQFRVPGAPEIGDLAAITTKLF